VYGFQRTADAVTRADGIWVVFGITMAIYLILAIGLITVLRAMSRRWRAQDEGRIPASDDDRVPYGPVPTKPAAKPTAG